MGFISVGVHYSAGVLVPEAGFAGGVFTPDNQKWNIMIGQGCVAGLNPLNGITFQNFHWSVEGNTFKYYDAHGLPSGGFATLKEMSDSDWQFPSPIFYWAADGAVNGTSMYGNVTAEAFVTINGISTNIGTIAATKGIRVWAPYYFCGYNCGSVQTFYDDNGFPRLGAGRNSGTNPQYGITWTGRVLPPTLFADDGDGLWKFDQIIWPGRWRKSDDGVEHRWQGNREKFLDTSYPYGPGGSIDPPGDNPNIGIPDNDFEWKTGDIPSLPLSNDDKEVTIDEYFWCHMMYRPAETSYGHQWVPLHVIAWHWGAHEYRPNTVDWIGGVPKIIVPVTATDFRYKHHPLWNQVMIAATNPWIP